MLLNPVDIPYSFILAQLVEYHTMQLSPLLETFWDSGTMI
jgi:hypothetical protein